MSLRALLPGIRSGDLAAAAVAGYTAAPAPLDLVSPYAPAHNLARVLEGQLLADVFGTDVPMPMTRAEAMAVPAVARARHIICGTVARVPMRGTRGGVLLEGDAAPPWISATTSTVPAYHRDLWTADDLLFHGWSCWTKVNGANGHPLRMDRIPMGRWSVDEAGRTLVADPLGVHRLVDQRTVCTIPGPHEGILTAAAGTIRHAADLQRAAAMAAKHPSAYLAIRQVQGTPVPYDSDDPEVVSVVSTLEGWRRGRQAGGGVGFIPLGFEAQELGAFDQHLVTEGRNAAAVDIARVCSLPADLLDAAGPSSLTYATTRDNDLRAIQYGVGLYLSSISARLSQDDVTPHGQAVRYALEDWLDNPVGDAARPADVSRETSAPVSRETSPAQELPA
jgi:hypothetical protein